VRWALVALMLAALPATGCGRSERAAPDASGTWRKAPSPPLSPRESARAVWTGREVLVLGGSDAPPCPPNAQCRATTEPPLRDGAAFNPRTGSWRRIADAPVGFDFAEAAVVGHTVFVATPGNDSRPGSPSAVIAYDVQHDRWRRLPTAPRPSRNYTLVAAGKRLVAYDRGGGHEEAPGYLLARNRRSWRPLPKAPLLPTRGQSMAWSGRELVLFRSAYVGRQALRPPLARAAALRLDTGRWRKLPDSTTVLFGHYWIRVGSRLVSPALGEGGPEYRWGRPGGGILDPQRGIWSDLPTPPKAGAFEFGTGVLTPTVGNYTAPGGWVLDTSNDTWIRVPHVEGRRVTVSGRALTNAGRKLLLFGGARFDRSTPGGRLLNRVWIWSPP
jgi:hypothetical protein